MLIVLVALVFVFFICCEKLSLGSRVIPSIVGNLLVASMLLLIDS